MGSLGEEELVEMVRDYMESDQSTTPVSLRTSNPLPRKSQSSLQVCFFFPVTSFSFIAKSLHFCFVGGFKILDV
jgi:hypothetical protein